MSLQKIKDPDSEPTSLATQALKAIMQLGELLNEAEQEAAEKAAELNRLEKRINRLQTVDLPEAMREAGMKEFKTESGGVVTLSEVVKCGIPKHRNSEAMEWLKSNGFGGLVKTVVEMEFGRGEKNKADELIGRLRAIEDEKEMPEPGVKETVHYQTLLSFVKEQLEAGNPIDEDLFGIYPYDKAVYKAPKKKKGHRS